jgi:hypothetical protein
MSDPTRNKNYDVVVPRECSGDRHESEKLT